MTAFLQCDADGCGHLETVPEISRDLIGKPCPKCGANLLTEADCEAFLSQVMPGIELAKALGLLRPAVGDIAPDEVVTTFHLHEDTTTIQVGPAAKVGVVK
jgi:hypothetical protein